MHRLRVRRAEDDLADRRGLVVHVAEVGVQAIVVERRDADQSDLLLGREDELDAGMRPALGEHAADRLEHAGDSRLVVGAEDRPARVADDAVLDDRLERAGRRHGVEVRAEEQRHPFGRRLEPRVDVSHRAVDLRAGAVLVRREPQVAQIAEHDIGDGALLARRARQCSELEKEREDVVGGLGGHRGIVVGGGYETAAV